VSGYSVALFEHPVFEFELFAYTLIWDLVGVLIGAGRDRQIDHTLVFRFQLNRHEGLRSSRFGFLSPYPAAPPASTNILQTPPAPCFTPVQHERRLGRRQSATRSPVAAITAGMLTVTDQ
jgi:hypothetical protein